MSRRRIFLFAVLLAALGLSSCARSLVFGRYTSDSALACSTYPLTVYKNEDYNRERAAHDYLLFAVASLNAYEVEDIEPHARYLRLFTVSNYDPAWRKVESDTSATGLALDVYWRETAELLDVMVAIRGTERSIRDWYSNLSWITQVIPVPNEYDAIRPRFQAIVGRAEAAANGRQLRFVATGHSLGGGLAQHLAAAYPCVSAAVFNTSPVANRHHLSQPKHDNLVVQIYEDNDELRLIREWTGTDSETAFYRKFGMNLALQDMFQHGMSRLAVGMSRLVANCQFEARSGLRRCAIPASDTSAANIYCKTFASRLLHPGNADKVCDTVYSSPNPEFAE